MSSTAFNVISHSQFWKFINCREHQMSFCRVDGYGFVRGILAREFLLFLNVWDVCHIRGLTHQTLTHDSRTFFPHFRKVYSFGELSFNFHSISVCSIVCPKYVFLLFGFVNKVFNFSLRESNLETLKMDRVENLYFPHYIHNSEDINHEWVEIFLQIWQETNRCEQFM